MAVWGLDFVRLNYFAFVTLTTTGYGDVVPRTPLAQMASVSVAVIGTLYVTVVMGLLISRLMLKEARQHDDAPNP
jgi:voltage-gated potassium channel Kch